MSRVAVIGGTGHVGTYLVPRLVDAGHDVIVISRGQREPYQPHEAWDSVETLVLDRAAEESAGTFGKTIRALDAGVVIDMICFTPSSTRHLVEALRGDVDHLLHTGTIWVHGPSVEVPTTEMQPRRPFGDYGIQKAAIESYLLAEARNGLPVTVIHPGHIVGPGWVPLNPEGHFNPDVFTALAQGREVVIPNFGMETVHHVHADDVAQAFMGAIVNRRLALGEAFHVVSPAAVTLRGYAEAMADWFGTESNLRFLPWREWQLGRPELEIAQTYDHIAHSPNCSIAKAGRQLGYEPRYGSLEAVFEAVSWLVDRGIVKT
jgi:nucleoside-diphosphate-sugar epimerase